MLTQEKIIKDIQKVQQIIGHPPTKKEYNSTSCHHARTAARYFGSWSKALFAACGIIREPNTPKPPKSCPHCGALTKNPKFCSRSCSASYLSQSKNGRKIGSRKTTAYIKCSICDATIEKHLRKKRCDKCRDFIKTNSGYKHPSHTTKADMLVDNTQKYNRIRAHARQIARLNNKLESCFICGYKTYVETAHITSIESFPDDTLLTVINDISNLVGLCPNHHWEFDHDLIELVAPAGFEPASSNYA